MLGIGTGIGKRKCVACVMDQKKNVREEASHGNTQAGADEFAKRTRRRYKSCQAVCEPAGNMWPRTFDASGSHNIPIRPADTPGMRITSTWTRGRIRQAHTSLQTPWGAGWCPNAMLPRP